MIVRPKQPVVLPYAVYTTLCTRLLGTSYTAHNSPGTSYTETGKRLTNGVLISILLNSVHTHDWVVDLDWHIPALHLKVLVELLPAHLENRIVSFIC